MLLLYGLNSKPWGFLWPKEKIELLLLELPIKGLSSGTVPSKFSLWIFPQSLLKFWAFLYGEFGPPTEGLPSPIEIKIWSFEKAILDPKCPALELIEFVLKIKDAFVSVRFVDFWENFYLNTFTKINL